MLAHVRKAGGNPARRKTLAVPKGVASRWTSEGHMKTTLLAVAVSSQLGVAMAQTPPADPPQLGVASIQEVVAAMTAEEKIRLLVGMGMKLDLPGGPPVDPEDAKVPEKVPGAAGRTHAIPRLGIPSLTLADGPAGVRIAPRRPSDPSRSFFATGFPIASLLASTWDVDLVQKVGEAFGAEAREYGVDVLLAPGLNLHRSPLGGRNFEYYSEDPLVSGKMAAAFVRGVQSKGVGTSVKHFAANNQEWNRMQSNSIVGERALRELYLKGFEIAVKEGRPWTVMSAYNLVNGTYTSQSRDLLTTVLRDEWGFGGLVMSDWFAGSDPIAQIAAGNDLIMPGLPMQTAALAAAAGSGGLDQATLDRAVERALRLVTESPTFKRVPYFDQPDLWGHAQVARLAGADGMVLLKNAGRTLPLPPARQVALFGNASYDLFAGGTGSGDVNKEHVVSLDAGLAGGGHAIDAGLQQAYRAHLAAEKAKQPPRLWFMPLPPIPELPLEPARIESLAAGTDLAIVTLGRSSGETIDRQVEDDFTLTKVEQALVRDVSAAFHAKGKKVIVVLNVGGVIEVASWRDQVDAILLAWQPGQEGGLSIADVLRGAVSPSGRLAATFPLRYEDVPSARNFPGREWKGQKPLVDSPLAGSPAEVVYEEGLYVGYRYHDTFDVKPAYEFGFGLSYSDFTYGALAPSAARLDGPVTLTARVTNAGQAPCRAVAQLYVGAPAGRLDHPRNELKAFAKTRLLGPGESQDVTFTLSAADLASFDTARSAWVVEPGAYELRLGASSRDVKSTARLTVPKEIVVQEAHSVLAPRVPIRELSPKR
jgi:beta-glucosidase